jgi:hypothetical protein
MDMAKDQRLRANILALLLVVSFIVSDSEPHRREI